MCGTRCRLDAKKSMVRSTWPRMSPKKRFTELCVNRLKSTSPTHRCEPLWIASRSSTGSIFTIDADALDQAGGHTPDDPVNLTLSAATLRSALRIMLKPMDLTYVIREGTLTITSSDDAAEEPVNKIYPVGDHGRSAYEHGVVAAWEAWAAVWAVAWEAWAAAWVVWAAAWEAWAAAWEVWAVGMGGGMMGRYGWWRRYVCRSR